MSYAEIEAEIKKALHITDPENMQRNLANGYSSVNSGQQSKKEIASQDRKPAENFPPKPMQLLRYEQMEGGRNFSGGGGGIHVWQQPVTSGGNTDVSPRKRNRRKKKNDFGQNDVLEHDSLNPNDSRNQDGNAAVSEYVAAVSCQSVVEPIVRDQAQMPHSRFSVKQEFPFSVMPSAKNCNVLESLVVTSNRQEHDYKVKPEYRETENVVAGECSGSVSSHSVGEAMFKTNEHASSSVCSIKQEYPFGLASSYDASKPAKFSIVRGNEATTAKSSCTTKLVRAVAPVSEGKPDFVHQIPVERRQPQSEMCRQGSGEEPAVRLEDRKDRQMRAQGSAETKAPSEPKTSVASSKKQDSQTPASNEKIEKELEANYIFPLKKKSTKFTNAKYFCRLCEYHCDSVSHCQQHMKTTRHERLFSVLLEENLLRDMVSPSPAHDEAVTQVINRLLTKLTPTESEQRDRFIVFLKIEELVKQISKDAVAAVYGSTVSLTALRDSDLNIDVNDSNPARLLMTIYQILKDDQSGYFCDVRSDFQSKFPAVYATVSALNLRVQIGVNNGQSVLTSRLLSVYFQLDKRARPLAIAFRHWAKMCRIDCQAEGTLPAYVFGLMTVYFLQQCSPPVLPVLHELFAEQIRDSGGNIGCLLHLENVQEKWQSSPVTASDVGKLWIEMLRFYCLELNTMDAVVCVRESRLVKRAEKKWTSKKLAIEDPCICKRNVARSLSHSQIYEYIDEQLRHAYKYFGMMQDNGFSFDDVKLLPKKGPGVICSICQREGHLKTNCPEDTLPPLPRLPTLNRQYINILNKVLHQIFDDCRPRERELKQRKSLLDELHSVVQSKYPAAKLCLFGSSCNGFGFQNSDLDISLTFNDHKTAENLNCVEIIETLTKKLKQHRGFYNVFAITTAKVPIVKFKHSRSQLEGDISLYNTLAQHNTRMLQTYADIDIRVRILGYSMKVLAKSCDICDASRGSLSSYAYTLMVIYYLQQRKNPVIPVLQELYRGRRPEALVDGWNAWFFEDLKNLTKFWNGKNQESVAELWIGLLRFYTEEFNIKEMVVSIRQREPLTKFEKLWNGSGIAIEDPFNLDHNLGSALSRKMNVYILKVLRSARHIHGTPVNRLDPRYMTMADYLFDAYVLIDAPPPNDRGCRRCGKIGHFVNECPLLNRKSKQTDVDPDEEEEDDPSKDKVNAKDIPTLSATKEPQKISKTDSMKPSSVSSTESPGNQHSSGLDVLSTPPASSSNSGRLDDGSSNSSSSNLRTEPHSPLLSSPLVFHNSNFSPSNTAVTPMEVFGSQVHGGSYLVPSMFQPVVPFIQQPTGMAMPNPLMSQWVAAATMSANQVDQQSLNLGTSVTPNFPGMTGQLPASSAMNVPTKPGQTQQMSPLMSLPLPLMNLPFYTSPAGNQGNMTLENFSQLALNANRQTSAGVEGHPMYIGQHSQGQKQSQVEHGSVGQAQLLLPPQMENKVPGQSLQTDLLNKVQGQQVQRQGHAHGYPMQSQLKDHQLQNQFQRITIPGTTDAKLQSHLQGQPAEALGPMAMGNLRAPASKTDQRAGMLKTSHGSPQMNPLNYNQFSFPVGAIDRPSVNPSSAFTAMMAHHYQQQYQHQCYQDILQASLLQALGINNSGSSTNVVPVQSMDSAAASVNSQFSLSPAVSGDNNSCGSERSADQLSRIAGSQHVAANKLDKAQKEPGIK